MEEKNFRIYLSFVWNSTSIKCVRWSLDQGHHRLNVFMCLCVWAKEASLNAYIRREQYKYWTLVGIFRRRVTAYSQIADLMYG